jgi:integrase/recombinase XerD
VAVDEMSAHPYNMQGSPGGIGLSSTESKSKILPESSLDAFAGDLALQGRTEVYMNTVMWQTRSYLSWAHRRPKETDPLSKDTLLGYLGDLRARAIRQSTIERIFSNLSVYFSYLVEAGELQQNPIPAIQKRYLKSYKSEIRQRQLIGVDAAAKMVKATIDTRDRAVLLLFLKTGIRRNELISLDVADVDLPGQSLTLKPTAKRSNRVVFFDDEVERSLRRWISARETRYKKRGETALFISNKGTRLQSSAVDILVHVAGERVGLHDNASEKLENKFTPHCCRHWNATHLLRAGMPREYMKWLRGDAMGEAIDIYNHIDPEEVRREYLARVPQLGV